MIATWSHTPAFIHHRFMDVLATNALITAIAPAVRPGVEPGSASARALDRLAAMVAGEA